MSSRGSRISQALRRDPFADPEPFIRRVYAYVAYRIGPGAPAEAVTRDVLTRGLESRAAERHTGVWLIDTARKELDERFVSPDRDRGFVALHLAGLDTAQIAELLGYREEAAAVAVGRALSRAGKEPERAGAGPSPEFVERLVTEIRAARRPVSRSQTRTLEVAIALLALFAAVPAFGALVAGDNRDENRAAECDRVAERLDVLPARDAEAQARLIARFNRERQAFDRAVRRHLRANPGSKELAAQVSRQLSALEARHSRELEASHERQSRELTRLEAERRKCDG